MKYSSVELELGFAFDNTDPAVQEEWKKKIIALISGAVILIIAAGSLKPMDGVTPYRLEIQAKVGIGNTKNLYEYWGALLYRSVIDGSRIIINLASKEYSKYIE